MKSKLFNQFMETAKENNHEHCERTFVSQNGKMFYQPYSLDYFYRGSNLSDAEALNVFMNEQPFELSEEEKKQVLQIEESVYNA